MDNQRYIAIREIKLAGGGSAKPGEEVIGAAKWRNVDVYVKSRFIRLAKPGELDAPIEPAPAPAEVEAPAPAPIEASAPAPTEDSGDEPSAMDVFTSVLRDVAEYPASHTIAAILEVAKAAGVSAPDPIPNRKAALVTALVAEAGIDL